jgi:hypothetical protein
MGKTEEDDNRSPEQRKYTGAAAPGLAFRRERAVAILSEGFARNLMGIEEFERRVAEAHGAGTLAELDRLIDDIPEELHAVSLPQGGRVRGSESEQGRRGSEDRSQRRSPPAWESSSDEQGIYGVMMSRRLRGGWLKSRVVAVRTLMSSTELDFRDVEMPPGEVEVRVTCLMSSVTITVPEHLAVQADVVPVLGELKEGRRVRVAARGETPSLLITGVAIMSEVRIRTR